MAVTGGGPELRVELASDEPGMVGHLDDLDEGAVERLAGDLESRVLQRVHVGIVELVAMPVPLADDVGAVHRAHPRLAPQPNFLCAESHRPAEVRPFAPALERAVLADPLGDQRDDRMRGRAIELRAVGINDPRAMAGVLDHRDLHPEADAAIRHLVLACVAHRLDLSVNPALAESAGDEDRVHPVETANAGALDLLGVDVADLDSGPGMDSAMDERLAERLVGLRELDVLPDHRDPNLPARALDAVNDRVPFGEIALRRFQPEPLHHQVVEPLLVEHAGDPVDTVGVVAVDHRALGHVGEQGDLAPFTAGEDTLGPAEQDVRLDADRAQLLHRMLRRLRLQLTGGADIGHQREMNEDRPLLAELEPHLTDRLEERQRFDVADGASDLDETHLCVARALTDAGLDLVGDVGDDLDGVAKVFAAPLLAQHVPVDLTGREVVPPPHGRADEAFVVAEVEIGLGAVFGDEHLSMLEGVHRPGIDVDVGIELDDGDAEPPGLEDRGERCGGDPLAE